MIARGNGGGRIVLDDVDRQTLVRALERTSERYDWRVHAYCLMDTHLHAVIETYEATLGMGMQRLQGRYAFEFNRRHARFGHLFTGRFKSSLVELESYALEVCACVVLNPLRAGLVRAPEDWRWSNYRASAGLVKVPPFVETRLVPGMLHPDWRRAQELYRQYVSETAERTRPGQAKA